MLTCYVFLLLLTKRYEIGLNQQKLFVFEVMLTIAFISINKLMAHIQIYLRQQTSNWNIFIIQRTRLNYTFFGLKMLTNGIKYYKSPFIFPLLHTINNIELINDKLMQCVI